MNEHPFFTIVVPIYNSEKYLDECVNSVLKQTFKDWEMILVDDGSTDGSGSICDEYQKEDARIKVIHKNNGGEFSSRLAAVNIAKGEYITGLDSDDYYVDDYLETVKNAIDEANYDCVMWSFTRFGECEGIIPLNKESIKSYSGEEYLHYIVESTLHSFCSKAIRTSLVKKVDYTKTPAVRMSEDYIMVIPSLCNVKSAKIIEFYGYMYRIHGDSTSNSVSFKKIYDLCEVSKYGLEVLRTAGYGTREFFEAEHKAFIQCTFSRIIKAIKENVISDDELETIWNHPAYVKSEIVENEANYSGMIYEQLKLFRNHRFEELRKIVVK